MVGIVAAIWGMLPAQWLRWACVRCSSKLLGMDMSRQSAKPHYHPVSLDCHGHRCHRNVHGHQPVEDEGVLQGAVRVLITVGYMLTMIFGLLFAYFGHNWAFHGLYITVYR